MERLRPLADGLPTAPEEQISADAQWNKEVVLNLVPHPAHPHAKTIERDFGMQHGSLPVTLRAAIAGYVLRQRQVDCSADAGLRGPEFRLWLADPQQLNDVDNAVLPTPAHKRNTPCLRPTAHACPSP